MSDIAIVNSYTEEELTEFKKIINKKILCLQKEIKGELKNLNDKEESGNEEVVLVNTIKEERLYLTIDGKKDRVNRLKNALLRIENKTFGICAETKKQISKERLILVPEAILSVEGQKIRERRRF